jgi:CheY-like chemotaxis protein
MFQKRETGRGSARPGGPSGQRKLRILVVDDSSTLVHVERVLLARQGYDIITASDGAAAVDSALMGRPDLVLMDLLMPRMSGVEACRRLREHEATRDIPVIVVSVRNDRDSVAEAYAAGCTDYIAKPFRAQTLLSKIRRSLAEREGAP